MKTTQDRIGTNKIRLTVEVPSEDVVKLLDRTYRRLAGEVRIPGFRPGKVPRQIIDQRLGKEFVRSEALRDALPEFFAQAVIDEDLDVVAPPEIDVKDFEDALTFEAVVEVKPTAEVKDYAGLKVASPPTEVTDEEAAEQLERLRVRYASLEVVNRPVKKEDFALIDLNTYRHDQSVDSLTAKDLLVEVGAEMVVPELDAELEGKRKGDILKLTTTLPERFGEQAGWQVGMQVLVKEVKARKLPELDDDLAKTVSEFDTLEELRADLRDRMERFKKAQAEMAVRERVMDAFVDQAVEVDLPDGMVEMEVDRLIRRMDVALRAQNLNLQGYLEAENIDGDTLRQRLRPQAEKNLTLQLGLEQLARQEGLEATEEERNAEVERLAHRMGRSADEVREEIEDEKNWPSLDGDIIRSKALDLLVDRAEISIEEGSA